MTNYQNYENMELNNVPEVVEGCNITNCTIHNEKDVRFERCNIRDCKFDNPATFVQSNVFFNKETPLPPLCVFDRSNAIDEENEELVEE